VIEFNTFASSVDNASVDTLELYLKDVASVMKVVSGSIITGVTEATAYDLRLCTILVLVVVVKLLPDLALIEI
jgi:hypothetical protein